MNLDFETQIAGRDLHELEVDALAKRCISLRDGGGVDTHCVRYRPEQWEDLLDVLPSSARSGVITRGDVRAMADVVAAGGDSLHLLTAAYIWGQGRNGYGRTRFDKIVGHNEDGVRRRLSTALDALRDKGPVTAYALLWGGDGRSGSSSRGLRSEQRIPNLGPAFYTKVLYFADRNALILDQVLARRVAELSKLPHFTRSRGRAVAWSPYRYAVYLDWMTSTAQQVSEQAQFEVSADLLELALFGAKGDLSEEGAAGA